MSDKRPREECLMAQFPRAEVLEYAEKHVRSQYRKLSSGETSAVLSELYKRLWSAGDKVNPSSSDWQKKVRMYATFAARTVMQKRDRSAVVFGDWDAVEAPDSQAKFEQRQAQSSWIHASLQELASTYEEGSPEWEALISWIHSQMEDDSPCTLLDIGRRFFARDPKRMYVIRDRFRRTLKQLAASYL